MYKYVLGFMFDDRFNRLLLIQKNNPLWQKGRFNGLGGKIEPKETPIEAMVREFKEETGLTTFSEDWHKFCTLKGLEWVVHVYTAVGPIHFATSETDEKLSLFFADNLPSNQITNLSWLVPLAKDFLKNKMVQEVKVSYNN